ncbi:MAG: anthranilate synthase component I [Armatimonadetes bacterium]|nr:anthranilate synthase component I [Armatimonadota bacterium]
MSAYYPDRKEFAKRAANGNLTPVYREIIADMETPVSAFKKIASGAPASFDGAQDASAYSFLLESVEGGERMARFSFLGSGTDMVITSKGTSVNIDRGGEVETIDLAPGRDVLHVLKEEIGKLKYVPDPDLPRFCGGAVGFIGYDMVRFFEDLPDTTTDDLRMPDCTFIFTDTILIFDHVRHKIRVVCNAKIDGDPDKAYGDAVARIDSLIEQLRQPLEVTYENRQASAPEVTSNFTQGEFGDAVLKCKEYIAAGDVIQVVLSQRFSTKVTAEPFDVYRALRSLNPSPYMYYLSYGDTKLIGSSPEILVTEERGNVTIRPIAGTRPRGKTPDEDVALERELLKDEKERAEHIMLVDLGRNDIGRVCRYGSVSVDELMVIERYSHVMHIVSNVRGRLDLDKDQFDLLRACFPAGTVSGAPKIRAMEIIDELEPSRRGSYAGAIGYFSYSGDMDTCITIRTILIQGDTAYVQAGAGIVADSDPTREYQETQNKAMAMIKALSAAEEGLE